jgi:hypothetical protein
LEGITSKYLSGILKIEDKSNSKGDIISYNYYQLYGRFNLVYSEENINTENKTFLTYEDNLKIFGSLKLEY